MTDNANPPSEMTGNANPPSEFAEVATTSSYHFFLRWERLPPKRPERILKFGALAGEEKVSWAQRVAHVFLLSPYHSRLTQL